MDIEIKRNQKLKERAKELRNNMTKAEQRLWYEVLSKDQLLGLRFVRQRIISGFIADFYCARLKLVIEVDGSSHDDNSEYDRERDQIFQKMGITVLRLRNEIVMTNIYTTKNLILKRCLELKPPLSKGVA